MAGKGMDWRSSREALTSEFASVSIAHCKVNINTQ